MSPPPKSAPYSHDDPCHPYIRSFRQSCSNRSDSIQPIRLVNQIQALPCHLSPTNRLSPASLTSLDKPRQVVPPRLDPSDNPTRFTTPRLVSTDLVHPLLSISSDSPLHAQPNAAPSDNPPQPKHLPNRVDKPDPPLSLPSMTTTYLTVPASCHTSSTTHSAPPATQLGPTSPAALSPHRADMSPQPVLIRSAPTTQVVSARISLTNPPRPSLNPLTTDRPSPCHILPTDRPSPCHILPTNRIAPRHT